MEAFYRAQVNHLLLFQERFSKHETVLQQINYISSPHFLALFVVPFLAIFDRTLIHKSILAMMASEYLCTLLKWVFGEDRPIWWANESFSHLARPRIVQSPASCVPSAASPDEHIAVLTTLLYIFANWMSKRSTDPFRKLVNWQLCFTLPLILGFMAKFHTASNFFHQLMIGFLFGLIVAKLIANINIGFGKNFIPTKRFQLVFISAMILIDLVFYFAQKDPQFAVKKAFKYCPDPSYPDPELTATFSLVKCFGLMCTLNLLNPRPELGPPSRRAGLLTISVLVVVASFVKGNLPRNHGVLAFYSASAVFYFMFYSLVVNIFGLPFFRRLGQRSAAAAAAAKSRRD